MIRYITKSADKKIIVQCVLEKLPKWFGQEKSIQSYVENAMDMPLFAYFDKGHAVGFIALRETSYDTAEIYVMGIYPQYHRKGIGRQLIKAFETYCKKKGYSFIQVKTVEKGNYPEYDQTNDFYRSMGFKKLEVFPDLWDLWNPCQILIKYIGERE